MKRTTIFVPEPLERDLQLYARRRNKPVAWVVREALATYLAAERPTAVLPSFTGIAASGDTDVATRHEALLWKDPHGAAPRPGPTTRVRSRRPAGRRR